MDWHLCMFELGAVFHSVQWKIAKLLLVNAQMGCSTYLLFSPDIAPSDWYLFRPMTHGLSQQQIIWSMQMMGRWLYGLKRRVDLPSWYWTIILTINNVEEILITVHLPFCVHIALNKKKSNRFRSQSLIKSESFELFKCKKQPTAYKVDILYTYFSFFSSVRCARHSTSSPRAHRIKVHPLSYQIAVPL